MSHQISTLSFPRPGCWKVSGQSGDRELTFIINVLPREEGPPYKARQSQIAEIEAERQEQIPYPVPETCSFVKEWSYPDLRLIGVQGEPVFAYWQDDVGISVGTTHGVLFEGENQLALLVGENLVADGASSDGLNIVAFTDAVPVTELDLEINRVVDPDTIRVDGYSAAWQATVDFPAPGCWALHISTTPSGEIIEQDLELFVYVYPAPGTAE